MTTEDQIVWEGEALFVLHEPKLTKPYAVCVKGSTHAVIIGRSDDREQALRCAKRLECYPENARVYANLL